MKVWTRQLHLWSLFVPSAVALLFAGRRLPSTRRQCVDSKVASRVVTQQTRFPVFIESTDCFGVMFYANYFKLFQYGLDDFEGGRLSRVDDMKYKDAAVLGDTLEIVTTRTDDGYKQLVVRNGAVLVSATTDAGDVEVVGFTEPAATFARHEVRFDDIDARTHALSLDAALRGFERSRSTLLGGPDALAELQRGDVTVVVCRVDGLRYRPRRVDERDEVAFAAGCRTRSSRFIVFDHQVEVAGEVAVVATVTCVCLDAPSGRPIAIPPTIHEKLFLTDNSRN